MIASILLMSKLYGCVLALCALRIVPVLSERVGSLYHLPPSHKSDSGCRARPTICHKLAPHKKTVRSQVRIAQADGKSEATFDLDEESPSMHVKVRVDEIKLTESNSVPEATANGITNVIHRAMMCPQIDDEVKKRVCEKYDERGGAVNHFLQPGPLELKAVAVFVEAELAQQPQAVADTAEDPISATEALNSSLMEMSGAVTEKIVAVAGLRQMDPDHEVKWTNGLILNGSLTYKQMDEEVAGRRNFSPSNPTIGYISMVYNDFECQGMSLSSWTLPRLVAIAQEWGLKELHLESLPSAVSLYEKKYGFEQKGVGGSGFMWMSKRVPKPEPKVTVPKCHTDRVKALAASCNKRESTHTSYDTCCTQKCDLLRKEIEELWWSTCSMDCMNMLDKKNV